MLYRRTCLIYAFLLITLFSLGVRLYFLSDRNASQEVLSGQYTRRLGVASHSGFIYERSLGLLSHESDGYILLCDPSKVKSTELNRTSNAISALCGVRASEVSRLLSEGTPFTLAAKESLSETALSGVYIFPDYRESSGTACHLIGYCDSDGNGVCGLRAKYGDLLSHRLSSSVSAVYEANAANAVLSDGYFTLYDKNYSQNAGLVLTIDGKMQRFADSLSDKIKSGAVVISDTSTGEILAMSSFPGFDKDKLSSYLNSDKGEFINRALSVFTPGSVFKLVVAAAALEKDGGLSDFHYTCTGSYNIGKDIFHCHELSGHGEENLRQAFANSCNTYFIELARQIGLNAIIETAKKMGVGEPVFADRICSAAANLPSGKGGTESFLANISFGQGTLLMSPLDFVNVVNVCATGKKPPLSIVRGIYDGQRLLGTETSAPQEVLSEETVFKMRDMMRLCVTGGTGRAAQLQGVSSGGKTATAQTGSYYSDGTEKVHRWFCGIYPASSPKYTVIILCDKNARNSASPAEIFRNVCEMFVNCGY